MSELRLLCELKLPWDLSHLVIGGHYDRSHRGSELGELLRLGLKSQASEACDPICGPMLLFTYREREHVLLWCEKEAEPHT